MDKLPPQPLGYNLTVADLRRAALPPEVLGKIILENPQQPNAAALLAAILKSQRKTNALYRPATFNFAIWNRQLLFAANPTRSYLIIQNVGSGDLLVVFEDGPAALENDSSAQGQLSLTGMQTRALRIVGGGYFEPLVPPSNAVTIFTINTATNGVAIEGS